MPGRIWKGESMSDSQKINNLKLLEYHKLWLDYSILTMDILHKQVYEFKADEDQHPEHYRYRTFKNYIQSHLYWTDIEISRLFEIIKTESDYSVRLSMGLDLLKLRSVTSDMFKFVANSLTRIFGAGIQKYIDREIAHRRS